MCLVICRRTSVRTPYAAIVIDQTSMPLLAQRCLIFFKQDVDAVKHECFASRFKLSLVLPKLAGVYRDTTHPPLQHLDSQQPTCPVVRRGRSLQQCAVHTHQPSSIICATLIRRIHELQKSMNCSFAPPSFDMQAKMQYDRRALSEGKDDKIKFELNESEITVTDAQKNVSGRRRRSRKRRLRKHRYNSTRCTLSVSLALSLPLLPHLHKGSLSACRCACPSTVCHVRACDYSCCSLRTQQLTCASFVVHTRPPLPPSLPKDCASI